MADAGEPLRVFGNPPERWLEFLPAYAELQLGETAYVAEHLEHGVPDLRVDRLPELYDVLLRADLPLDASEHAALQAFAPRFAARCGELEAAGIGPSVQHDDLHMNNVYVKGDALRVLDWGDASIAHPFFSLFEVFRFLRRGQPLAAGRPVVRPPARRLPRAVGTRPARVVRRRPRRRRVRARDRVVASTRQPPGRRPAGVRRRLLGHLAARADTRPRPRARSRYRLHAPR